MKNALKRGFVSILMLTMALFITACGKEELEQPTDPPQGVWENDGHVFLFLPDEGAYVYKTPEGRIGRGSFDTSANQIFFNGFIYDLIYAGDGEIMFDQNGESAYEKENLNGMTFYAMDESSFSEYDKSDLSGLWINEDNFKLTLDVENMEYSYSSENGAGMGTMGDLYDGRGLYLTYTEYDFVIYDAEKESLEIITDDPEISGTVFYRN